MKPKCCNQEATYVNLGPRLTYYYCQSCKKEVPTNVQGEAEGTEDFFPMHLEGKQDCKVDYEEKVNYHYWKVIVPGSFCNCGRIN